MSLQAARLGNAPAQVVPGRTIPYARRRVTGGSSAVNAGVSLCGGLTPTMGRAGERCLELGWGASVLPPPRSGSGVEPSGAAGASRGRWREAELIPTQRAFFEVCRGLGFPEVADHNHPDATGVGPSRRPGTVAPARDRDRLPWARPRPVQPRHPAVLPRSTVSCSATRGQWVWRSKSVGSENGSMGSGSPQGRARSLADHPLRSGIGRKHASLDLGIEPIVDLPGVGVASWTTR